MFLVGMFKWWYRDGLNKRIAELELALEKLVDFFSLDILIATLFEPFRQISATRLVSTSPEIALEHLGDMLMSRFVGLIVRSVTLLIGILTISFAVMVGIVVLTFWLLAPLMPVIGFILASEGTAFYDWL